MSKLTTSNSDESAASNSRPSVSSFDSEAVVVAFQFPDGPATLNSPFRRVSVSRTGDFEPTKNDWVGVYDQDAQTDAEYLVCGYVPVSESGVSVDVVFSRLMGLKSFYFAAAGVYQLRYVSPVHGVMSTIWFRVVPAALVPPQQLDDSLLDSSASSSHETTGSDKNLEGTDTSTLNLDELRARLTVYSRAMETMRYEAVTERAAYADLLAENLALKAAAKNHQSATTVALAPSRDFADMDDEIAVEAIGKQQYASGGNLDATISVLRTTPPSDKKKRFSRAPVPAGVGMGALVAELRNKQKAQNSDDE